MYKTHGKENIKGSPVGKEIFDETVEREGKGNRLLQKVFFLFEKEMTANITSRKQNGKCWTEKHVDENIKKKKKKGERCKR